MTELLPCPFCGGEASKRLFYKGKYRVHCNVCDAHSGDVCDTESEAIAAWNTRASYEADSYFFLPKPKESLYSVSEPTYFVDGYNVKATCGVSIMEDSVKRWQRQIEESMSRDVVGRICEVFGNTRAERTCRNVNINGYSLRFECSACGFASITTNCETRMDELPKHCPNCGAKITEVDE